MPRHRPQPRGSRSFLVLLSAVGASAFAARAEAPPALASATSSMAAAALPEAGWIDVLRDDDSGIELVLRRNPELLATPLGDSARGLIAAGLLSLALILSVVFPNIGLLWALLLVLQGTVARLLRRV